MAGRRHPGVQPPCPLVFLVPPPRADTRAGEGEAKGGREWRPGGCAPSRCSWQSALFPASSFSSSRLFRKLNIQLMAEWLRRALGALVPGVQAPLGTAPAVRRKRFLLLLLLLFLLLLLLLLPFLSSPHPLQVRGLRAEQRPPTEVSPGVPRWPQQAGTPPAVTGGRWLPLRTR